MHKIFQMLLQKYEREIFSWVKKIQLKGEEYLVELSNIALDYLKDHYNINALLILNSISIISEKSIKCPKEWKRIVLKYIDRPGANTYVYTDIMLSGEWNPKIIQKYLEKIDDLAIFRFSKHGYKKVFSDLDIVESFVRIHRKGYQPYIWFGREYDETGVSEMKKFIHLNFLKAIKNMDLDDLNIEKNIVSHKNDIYLYINKIVNIRNKIEKENYEIFIPFEEIETISDIYADLWCLDYFADKSSEILKKFKGQKLENFIGNSLLIAKKDRGDLFYSPPQWSKFTTKEFVKYNHLKEGDIDDLINKIENEKIDFFDMDYATNFILKEKSIDDLFGIVKKMKNKEAAGWLVKPVFNIDKTELIKFHRETEFRYLSIDGISDMDGILSKTDIPMLVNILNNHDVKTKEYKFHSYHNTFEGRLFFLINDLTIDQNKFTDCTKKTLNKIKNNSSLFMKIPQGLQYALGYIKTFPRMESFEEKNAFVHTALTLVSVSSFIQNKKMAEMVAEIIRGAKEEQNTHILNYITHALVLADEEVIKVINSAINDSPKFNVSSLQGILLSDETNLKNMDSFEMINSEKWFIKLVSEKARWIVRMSIYNGEDGVNIFENFLLFKPELISCIKNDDYRIEPFNFEYYLYFMMICKFSKKEILNTILKIKEAEPMELMRSINSVRSDFKTLEWLKKTLTKEQLLVFTKKLAEVNINTPHQLL